MNISRSLGATLTTNGCCDFCVWAPFASGMCLEIIPIEGPIFQLVMVAGVSGYYYLHVDGIQAGDRYYYCFDNNKCADPASDYQPDGIHGPSEIIARHQSPAWKAHPLEHYIIYELHVGTYTEEGTFSAIIPYLDELKDLGITAIELMPIAQFSGARNWGYDGVFPFAVQNSYGDPSSLKAFILACHKHNISVILDVVYNHLGPEGNVFNKFGPYFTDKYSLPWGKALNFDGEYNQFIRRYFIENALHWFIEYGFDALRLDAVHAIVDMSSHPFIAELTEHLTALSSKLGRQLYLIAEYDAHDLRVIRPIENYGYGMHAFWNNDFHYALHALLTKENHGLYADFGDIDHVIKAYKEGFVYSGQYSNFHKKPYGVSSKNTPTKNMVVSLQNHDHIGNRMLGGRLTTILSIAELKLAAGLLLCSPYIPLLFMGEEYGETAPFLYFISHENLDLIAAVRRGRAHEFGISEDETPDPELPETFIKSKLNHAVKHIGQHGDILAYYKSLLSIRKAEFNIDLFDKKTFDIVTDKEKKLLKIQLIYGKTRFVILALFSNEFYDFSYCFDPSDWQLIIASFDSHKKDCTLNPYGFMLYKQEIFKDD